MTRTRDIRFEWDTGSGTVSLTLQGAADGGELLGVVFDGDAALGESTSLPLLRLTGDTATVALRAGATARQVADAWEGARFPPYGRVSVGEEEVYAHSILDWAARVIRQYDKGRTPPRTRST